MTVTPIPKTAVSGGYLHKTPAGIALLEGTNRGVGIFAASCPDLINVQGVDLSATWRHFQACIDGRWRACTFAMEITDEENKTLMFFVDFAATFLAEVGNDEDTPFLKAATRFIDTARTIAGLEKTDMFALWNRAFPMAAVLHP